MILTSQLISPKQIKNLLRLLSFILTEASRSLALPA